MVVNAGIEVFYGLTLVSWGNMIRSPPPPFEIMLSILKKTIFF